MKFYGELLILLLLLITNLRVFFVNQVRRDSLTAIVPLSFTLSILQIFAWGVDVFTIITFIVAVFVFFSNFHAMFRFSEHLYVDHYSVVMKIWAIFTTILTLLTLAITIYFAPIELNNEKIGVKEELTRYNGNFRSGFEPAHIFDSAEGFFYEFKKAPELGGEPLPSDELILFIPDKRGDTQNYKPYLQLLAQKNYTVCSANFYAEDLRWLHSFGDRKNLRRFISVLQSIGNNQKYMSQREFYTYNTFMECNTLLQLVNEKYGTDVKFYLISDVTGKTAIQDFYKNNSNRIKGIFCLDSIAEYKTPGYGLIEQTDPLLAFILGLPRDSKLSTPNKMVESTIDFIKANTPLEEENDSDSAE